MTKDAQKMLCCLYNIFRERNKTESREEAKEMQPEEVQEKCKAIFDSEDVDDLLSELEEYGFVQTDVTGCIYLQNSAIEKVESIPRENFEYVVDIISKLKP